MSEFCQLMQYFLKNMRNTIIRRTTHNDNCRKAWLNKLNTDFFFLSSTEPSTAIDGLDSLLLLMLSFTGALTSSFGVSGAAGVSCGF